VTGHGLALGTPAFMAPEQAAGLPEIDGRADLFSLAATAFYCLTGQHVHEAETVLQQIIKMAKDPAPPLKSVFPRASDDVAAIIDRALQVDRDMRYENAAAMHADVKAALDARMANDKRRTLITAVSIPPDALRDTAELPAVQPKEEEDEKKGSGFPVFFLFLLVLALAGGGWIFWPKIKARFLHEVRPDVTAPPVEASALPSASAAAADAAPDLDATSSSAADLDEAGADAATDAATDGGDDDDEFEEEDASAAGAPSASASSSAKTPAKIPPKKRKKKPKHPRK